MKLKINKKKIKSIALESLWLVCLMTVTYFLAEFVLEPFISDLIAGLR